MNRILVHGAAALLLPVLSIAPADAQENLQEAAQNPIASLISVPIQNSLNFNVGQQDETQYVMNLQPVAPFPVTDSLNLIVRPILPIIHKPKLFPGDDVVFGIGDLNPQLFLVPDAQISTPVGSVTWGAGAAFQLPTATDSAIGSGKWAAGPAAVVFVSNNPWNYGAVVSNLWSFAGSSSRADVNQMVFQPFVNYNLSGGWSIGTGPVIAANWEASSDNVWTVPVGLGISRLFAVGTRPVKASLSSYYNVLAPDNAADWQLQFQISLLFPR